ncbi:MAG TPA: tetratricopeptide repeat protein [Symbiobacteriaceae bacterium]|nr:tetratricopeptide repeat protein [Symbiobacteriaceae bacterium]
MEQEELTQRIAAADALYGRGQMEQALAAYQAILSEENSVAWAHSRVGGILAQRGELEAAAEALHKALELDADLPQAHSNLGNIYYTRGEFEQAIACYKEATRLDPHNPLYYENLHAAYKRMKKYGEAVASLKQAHRVGREAARNETSSAVRRISTSAKRRLGCLPTAIVLLVLATGLLLTLAWA